MTPKERQEILEEFIEGIMSGSSPFKKPDVKATVLGTVLSSVVKQMGKGFKDAYEDMNPKEVFSKLKDGGFGKEIQAQWATIGTYFCAIKDQLANLKDQLVALPGIAANPLTAAVALESWNNFKAQFKGIQKDIALICILMERFGFYEIDGMDSFYRVLEIYNTVNSIKETVESIFPDLMPKGEKSIEMMTSRNSDFDKIRIEALKLFNNQVVPGTQDYGCGWFGQEIKIEHVDEVEEEDGTITKVMETRYYRFAGMDSAINYDDTEAATSTNGKKLTYKEAMSLILAGSTLDNEELINRNVQSGISPITTQRTFVNPIYWERV